MENNTTTIYIVRHGQSEGNLKYDHAVRKAIIKYGELGAPLTDLGRRQANEAALRLNNIRFDAIFSSDLTRAVETAEIIAAKLKMQVTTISTIRERNYGDKFWDLTIAQRKEMEQGLKALNDEENLHYRFFPDSESEFEAVQRFRKFLSEIIPLYIGKTILVVNHGNVMRSFLKQICWAKYSELPSGAIENTGYFVLITDNKEYKVKETWKVNKKVTISQNEE